MMDNKAFEAIAVVLDEVERQQKLHEHSETVDGDTYRRMLGVFKTTLIATSRFMAIADDYDELTDKLLESRL